MLRMVMVLLVLVMVMVVIVMAILVVMFMVLLVMVMAMLVVMVMGWKWITHRNDGGVEAVDLEGGVGGGGNRGVGGPAQCSGQESLGWNISDL